MSSSYVNGGRRGFSLIELLVVISIIALLMSILLPALAAARKAARQAVCMANMQQIGRAHAYYMSDYKEYIATFYSKSSGALSSNATGRTFSDIEKIAKGIIQEYTETSTASLRPIRQTTSAYEQHAHLVLIPYLGDKLPMPAFACPEDAARLAWYSDPLAIGVSANKPQKLINSLGYQQWLGFSSSYQLLPASSIGTLQGRGHNLPGYESYSQLATHDQYNLYYGYKTKFFDHRQPDILFPSQKVAVADTQDRHSGKQDLFYAYPRARQPLLFWDSSVRARRTGDANPGWDSADYTSMKATTTFDYVPDLGFESPVPAEGPKVTGYYRWTRGDLKGIDYNGAEISTKNWKP